jgi:transcription initiation factor TFIIE subunit alpha
LIAVTDDIFSKVAYIIGGEDAVKVILALKELGEVTDDMLLPKTELKLNDIHKILFKLQNHCIVKCDNSRNKDTGWFVIRWSVQPDQVEAFISNRKKQVLRILKTRFEYEKKYDFYYCNTPECKKITFEDAVDIMFRCPTCDKSLEFYDNSATINALADKIEQMENEKN